MNTKLVHCKKSEYDIYIGRPSLFGNLWSHLPKTQAKFSVSTRWEAINNYRDWLLGLRFPDIEQDRRKAIIRQLPFLKGKTLGCWCSPNPCHGDVLIEFIEEIKS